MPDNFVVQTLDEEASEDWDCEDWCFIVTDASRDEEVVCVTSTEEEATHIANLLNANPPPSKL